MSERHEPITPTVIFLDDRRHYYHLPTLQRLVVEYGTAYNVRVPTAKAARGAMSGSMVQTRVWCCPSDDAWNVVVEAHAAFQHSFDVLADVLRKLGRYHDRLVAAGGADAAPNPLTATALWCRDPDGEASSTTMWTLGLIPDIERHPVLSHTAKMLQTAATTRRHQADHWLCPDDTAWKHIQAVHADLEAQRDVFLGTLDCLGTYHDALRDDRYRGNTMPTMLFFPAALATLRDRGYKLTRKPESPYWDMLSPDGTASSIHPRQIITLAGELVDAEPIRVDEQAAPVAVDGPQELVTSEAATDDTITMLPIEQIQTDGGTQARAGLDESILKEYAALLDAGVRFPAIQVIYDGTTHWLIDGFHRLKVHKDAKHTHIAAKVKPGTRRDAVLAASGANATHGLRRSNADKRRAILMLLEDEEWRTWGNREIARRTGVDHKTVGDIRKSLVASGEIPQMDIRLGADGRRRDVSGISAANAQRGQNSASSAAATIQINTVHRGMVDVIAVVADRILAVHEATDRSRRWIVTHRPSGLAVVEAANRANAETAYSRLRNLDWPAPGQPIDATLRTAIRDIRDALVRDGICLDPTLPLATPLSPHLAPQVRPKPAPDPSLVMSTEDAMIILKAHGYTVESTEGRGCIRWIITAPSGKTQQATPTLLLGIARELRDQPIAAPASQELSDAVPARPAPANFEPLPFGWSNVDDDQVRHDATGVIVARGMHHYAAAALDALHAAEWEIRPRTTGRGWEATHPVLRVIEAPTLSLLAQEAQVRRDQTRFAPAIPPAHDAGPISWFADDPQAARNEIQGFVKDDHLLYRFPRIAAFLRVISSQLSEEQHG